MIHSRRDGAAATTHTQDACILACGALLVLVPVPRRRVRYQTSDADALLFDMDDVGDGWWRRGALECL
jgi:hypothetical protein